MKSTTLSWLLISGLIATTAQGATYRYQGNGPWENLRTDSSGGWHIQGSADPFPHAAPDGDDTVRANWGGATVTLDFETTVGAFQLGVDESGTFHILDGGVLNGGNSKIGNNNTCTGTMIIDAGGVVNANGGWMMIAGSTNVTGVAEVSGTLNVAGHLWMATGTDSTATLTINDGGVVNVGANIGFGTVAPASAPDGGPATITVKSGGELHMDHWHNTGSIRDGSVLIVNSGGIATVGGNRVTAANDYITAGKITTNAAELIVTYDSPTNTTTITTPAPPFTAEISASGPDVTITWNGNGESLYNVWSTADLSEDLVDWDPAASAVDGSEVTIARTAAALFYRVEEYPKPDVLLNGDFDDPGALPAGGTGAVPTHWVDDMAAGWVYSWNPEDPLHFDGKPSGPFMVLMESDNFADGTAFGISQVLGETYADNTNYTVTVKAGKPKTHDWPGYRVELWADGTLIASVDDTTAGVPLDGKFVTVTLDYVAGTVGGLTPGGDLEVKLLSRNEDVDSVITPVLDWGIAFDDVTFSSTPN